MLENMLINGLPVSMAGIQMAKLLASDGSAGDLFGISTALNGEGTIGVVGADGDVNNGVKTGSAYVYRNTGSWSQVAKLTPPDGVAFGSFGSSVAASNDGMTIIVGARGDKSAGDWTGAAYVYRNTGGNTWQMVKKLLAPDRAAADFFGRNVDISGDGLTCIVGSSYDDDMGNESGSAYIFKGAVGNTWDSISKLYPNPSAANSYFGSSVSLSYDGTTCVVGAYYDDNPLTNCGSACIFRSNRGSWSQVTRLQANDITAGAGFGYSSSMSSDGKTCVIGAIYDSSGGAAYVFRNIIGTTWVQVAKLQSSDLASGDYFGISVYINADGTTCVVGSRDASGNTGAAYVFKRTDNDIWVQHAKLQAGDAVMGDSFGVAVSLSRDGETTLVGAYGKSDSGSASGAAYVFK